MLKLDNEKLRTMLFERNLSVRDLGVLSSVRAATIFDNLAHRERRPQFATILRIAKALGVEPKAISRNEIEYVEVKRRKKR